MGHREAPLFVWARQNIAESVLSLAAPRDSQASFGARSFLNDRAISDSGAFRVLVAASGRAGTPLAGCRASSACRLWRHRGGDARDGCRGRHDRAGSTELAAAAPDPERVRRPDGGRKLLIGTDPRLLPDLLSLVEPTERGSGQHDPQLVAGGRPSAVPGCPLSDDHGGWRR